MKDCGTHGGHRVSTGVLRDFKWQNALPLFPKCAKMTGKPQNARSGAFHYFTIVIEPPNIVTKTLLLERKKIVMSAALIFAIFFSQLYRRRGMHNSHKFISFQKENYSSFVTICYPSLYLIGISNYDK